MTKLIHHLFGYPDYSLCLSPQHWTQMLAKLSFPLKLYKITPKTRQILINLYLFSADCMFDIDIDGVLIEYVYHSSASDR